MTIQLRLPRVKHGVTVQAQDGRWHYGPDYLEAAMRASPKGAYRNAPDATQASVYQDPHATSCSSTTRVQIKTRT